MLWFLEAQQFFSLNPRQINTGYFYTKISAYLALKPSSPSRPGGGQNRPGGGSGNNNNRPGGGPNRPGGGPGSGPNRPGGGPGSGPSRPGGGTNTGPRPPGPPGSRPPGSPAGPGGRRPDRRFPQQQVPEHRINEFIRVPEVRLVGDNLEEIATAIGKPVETGIFTTVQLREWAEEMGLDVVEISPNAEPPVVRITDYNKFLYQKKKKEKEMKANAVKQQLKEIRFGPETGDHDFEFKLRHAKTFLEEGNKVKAYVQFRGRAIMFKERGELLLLRFLKELEEHGAAEQLPKLEGKRMIVIIQPKKGPVKKKD